MLIPFWFFSLYPLGHIRNHLALPSATGTVGIDPSAVSVRISRKERNSLVSRECPPPPYKQLRMDMIGATVRY